MSARRGIILIVVFILFAIGASVVASILFLAGPSAPPTVPDRSTLYLKITAPFDEVEQLSLFGQFGTSRTLRSTVDMIRKAKADRRVKTLVIKLAANGALWAQLQEVRAALVDFRASGKPITAFLEYGGGQEYYIASAADRIVMIPGGMLGLTGHASYELFFRGALDKLGVFPDLLHIGDYKTWSNTFAERGFTPAHREMTESLNHEFYDQLVKGIAEGRKKSEAEIIKAIDGGPYLAEDAKAAGLIDVVAWEDQLDDTEPIQGTRTLKEEDYARVPMSSLGLGQGQRIAVLYASGTIMSGESALDTTGGQTLGSETFVEWLRKVRVDPAIRAIIVRIDSPGGSAIASEVMWRELTLTRGLKPLIASMGNLAASGGYYIAAPADTIVAEPGTITGSIGVVTGKFVLKGTLDKLGVGEAAVSEGRMAQIESPFTPFSREERAKVEQQMHAAYDLFVSRVAEARKTTPERIDAVGQGRVWTGRQAQQLQLVDELGGLETAIRIAKERAKLDATKDVQLVIYPPKRSVYDLLADPLGFATEARLNFSLLQRPEVRVLERVTSIVQLFRRGEPLTLMPNIFWSN